MAEGILAPLGNKIIIGQFFGEDFRKMIFWVVLKLEISYIEFCNILKDSGWFFLRGFF